MTADGLLCFTCPAAVTSKSTSPHLLRAIVAHELPRSSLDLMFKVRGRQSSIGGVEAAPSFPKSKGKERGGWFRPHLFPWVCWREGSVCDGLRPWIKQTSKEILGIGGGATAPGGFRVRYAHVAQPGMCFSYMCPTMCVCVCVWHADGCGTDDCHTSMVVLMMCFMIRNSVSRP